MAIYYPDILEQATPAVRFSYGEKDIMLYALGIGLGTDPLNRHELAFVYEKSLKVIPSVLTVLGNSGTGQRPEQQVPEGRRLSTLDYLKVLHGEQKIEIHQPIPLRGSFSAEMRTVEAVDKGAHKGAVVSFETLWKDESGAAVATLTTTAFARGDGGFGGPTESSTPPHRIPDRVPDEAIDIATTPGQALLYRLNGDFNPLHCDPDVAVQAGFERPILHGLCTYGITCRAVVQWLGYDSDAIVSHQARFSSPVYPGEVISVSLWRDGNIISFEAHVKARGVAVIRNGKTVLR